MGHGDSQNGNLTIYGDFYAYDPQANGRSSTISGEARVAGTQFAADGKGYVLSGMGRPRSTRLQSSGATTREPTAGRSSIRIQAGVGHLQLCWGATPT